MKTTVCLILIICCFSCDKDTESNLSPTPTQASVSGTLPVLHIETENHKPIVSKEVYIEANYWLDSQGDADVASIGSETSQLPMQIRGRGHSSWKGAKKPYKIKLAEKQGILGMHENKHWALLKPSENTVAGFQLGKLMEFEWTPDFHPVEVVLNGDYIGLYFLTETVRIGKNRVNIHEQSDRETNPDLIKGGWLVEVDNYKDDCQISIPENDKWSLTIKYHSPEDLSEAQSQWLTDEFKSMNSAVYSDDKTSTVWEGYIDVKSMARFFILQEVMDNPDGFHGSFYLHKDLKENAKWVAGPIWDLVCYNREKSDYTFKMKVHYEFVPHWIGEIIQYGNFCKTVKSLWQEVYPSRLSEIYTSIDETMGKLGKAWEHDCKRWDGNPSETADVRASRIKNALRGNIEWFNNHLPVSSHE